MIVFLGSQVLHCPIILSIVVSLKIPSENYSAEMEFRKIDTRFRVSMLRVQF
jgi:hypothetical protein